MTVWSGYLEILRLKLFLNSGKQVIGRCESSDQEYCLKRDERGQHKLSGSIDAHGAYFDGNGRL